MAKSPRDESNTASGTEPATPATPATPSTGATPVVPTTGASSDERFKLLTVKYSDGTTKQEKRIDYIRRRWAEKASRSQITKEVSEFAGKKVPYQIIFAATKGVPGGPDKAPAAAVAPVAPPNPAGGVTT